MVPKSNRPVTLNVVLAPILPVIYTQIPSALQYLSFLSSSEPLQAQIRQAVESWKITAPSLLIARAFQPSNTYSHNLGC